MSSREDEEERDRCIPIAHDATKEDGRGSQLVAPQLKATVYTATTTIVTIVDWCWPLACNAKLTNSCVQA